MNGHGKSKDKHSGKRRHGSKELSRAEIRRIAHAIYKQLLRDFGILAQSQLFQQADPANCRYNPAAYNCAERGGEQEYTCEALIMAFGCASETPGAEYECLNFVCRGGTWDDFECGQNNVFDCNNFTCESSFDDEDCEGQFECAPGTEFRCGNGGAEYNN